MASSVPNAAASELTCQFCSGRRAIVVDLALSVTGSQLIASVLPNVCRPSPHGLDSNQSFFRSTRTSERFYMSRFVDTSLLSVVVRQVRRLSGYCECCDRVGSIICLADLSTNLK